MPYVNVYWIKLKLELLNDKRFIFDCNTEQKWLFIGLLLLAGATGNKIPNDEKYLKNRLNLPEMESKIRENLSFLLKTFPKLVSKNGIIKFKNFNKLHNRLGNSSGTPEELQWDTQIRKEQIDKIRREYIEIKGFSLKDFSRDDFARTAKAIKILLCKAKKEDNLVSKGLKWAGRQDWCDWTLETLIKKWADFMKWYKMPEIEKKYGVGK